MNFNDFIVVASNDINENVIKKLNDAKHQIDVFGIGTNLVTCQAQPALGMVYKLVDLNGISKIKLSEDKIKVLIPGKKKVYWVYIEGKPSFDLLSHQEEEELKSGDLNVYNPFTEEELKFTSSEIVPLT